MPKQPVIPLVLAVLKEHRRLTQAAICDLTGLPPGRVSTALNSLRKPRQRPVGPRRVRIAGWVDEHASDRRYLRAVYSLGRNPDAPKPDMAQRRRAQYLAFYHRNAGHFPIPDVPTSVFQLARYL